MLRLRPASTRWFEVLCPRSESVHTAAELAATGAVEVEVRERAPTHCPLAELTKAPSSLLAAYTSFVWVLIMASCASSLTKPDLASRARVIEIARR